MVKTADEMGVLAPNRVKSLYVQYARAGWSRGEPYPLTPEEPTVVSDAIKIHLRDHGLTKDELAGVVRLLPGEFATKWAPDPNDGAPERRLRAV